VLDEAHVQYQAIKKVIGALAAEQQRNVDAEAKVRRDDYRREHQAELDALKAADPEEWRKRVAEDEAQAKEYAVQTVDLYHCRSGSEFVGDWGEKNELVVRMADLAFDVWSWTNELQPYPKSVWEPRLSAYESAEIDRLIRDANSNDSAGDRSQALAHALAADLNDATREQRATLPKVIVEGGCGAGEFGVRIVTEPKGAQVLFIPSFFYELCRAQNVDPEDTTRCKRWREAIDGTVTQVAGDYSYVARWADGVTRRGKLRFTDAEEGPFDPTCQCHRSLITLSKP